MVAQVFFIHFVDTAIVSLHVIYLKVTNTNITMNDFCLNLFLNLVSNTLLEKRATQNVSTISPVELKKIKCVYQMLKLLNGFDLYVIFRCVWETKNCLALFTIHH